ncbi:MAG: HD domain-containing protein [Candidatus Moraniibacteriota bacterium]
MLYSEKIKKAIKFAIKTHEVYQKQKRKGKDTAYISHPLTVGLILATAGAKEDVIVAGILHDTIEDSVEEKKVTEKMLADRFGEEVSNLVLSVTEKDKKLSWDERKKEALLHVEKFSYDSLLLKSADILSNVTELVDDYAKGGDSVFSRFNAPKEKIIDNQLKVIAAILDAWKENPLADDLKILKNDIQKISALNENYGN